MSLPPHAIDEQQAIDITSSVSAQTLSFQATFDSIEAGDTVYQSVLASVRLPDAADLLACIKAAVKPHLSIGVRASDPPHFPHLSLFYGGIPTEAKPGMIRRLYDTDVVAERPGGGVEVAGVSMFEVGEIWLVRAEGPVHEWVVLAKRSLASP